MYAPKSTDCHSYEEAENSAYQALYSFINEDLLHTPRILMMSNLTQILSDHIIAAGFAGDKQ